MSEEVLQSFTVDFSFPVFFTQDLFAADNPVFCRAATRLEANKRHRVLFIVDENVSRAQPKLIESIHRYLQYHSREFELAGAPIIIPGGEGSKNDLAHVMRIAEAISERGIDRQSLLAVIGGGAILDMACFAGAICHRGIRTIRIPTTVLSQNDSGMGVKNGINWLGKKNFLGTFVPPFAVINDFTFIHSLDRRDRISGLAEAVKVSLIRDGDFFQYLEDHANELAELKTEAMNFQIRRCAEIHLAHIRTSGDPFEYGSARPLDFGHWSAHKLESMTKHRLRHGEAVAIGIAIDSVYSAKRGFMKADRSERVVSLLERLGFTLWDEALLHRSSGGQYTILAGLEEFREHLGGALTITLLREIGKGFEVHDMDTATIMEAIQWLRMRFELARTHEYQPA